MDNCIFCKIIEGTLPSAKIYEDDFQVAFLDLNPVNPGHSLLVPKKHYVNIFDADPEYAKHIYPALSVIANALKKATNCDGLNVIQNNGAAANQVVFHSHVHLIPRFENDNIRLAVAGKRQSTPEELTEMAAKIKKVMGA